MAGLFARLLGGNGLLSDGAPKPAGGGLLDDGGMAVAAPNLLDLALSQAKKRYISPDVQDDPFNDFRNMLPVAVSMPGQANDASGMDALKPYLDAMQPSKEDKRHALFSAIADAGAGISNAKGTYGGLGAALSQGLAAGNASYDNSMDDAKKQRLGLMELRAKLAKQAATFGHDGKAGYNPETKRWEYLQFGSDGSTRFSGVQAPAPEAKRRDRLDGTQLIQEEQDPLTGEFREIGRGAKFAPTTPVYQIVPGAEGYVAFNTKNPGEVVPLTAGGKPVVKPASGGGSEATGGERKAASSAMVMDNAEKAFSEAAGKNGAMSSTGYFASKIPVIGQALTSDADQKASQAMIDWYREKLRFESGATIGDKEALEEAKRYFPVPGDSADTIAQKQRARQVVMGGFKVMAGKAAPQQPASDRQAAYQDYVQARKQAYQSGRYDLVRKMDAEAKNDGLIR